MGIQEYFLFQIHFLKCPLSTGHLCCFIKQLRFFPFQSHGLLVKYRAHPCFVMCSRVPLHLRLSFCNTGDRKAEAIFKGVRKPCSPFSNNIDHHLQGNSFLFYWRIQ